MIVYHATKQDFASDVEAGRIDDIVLEKYRAALGHGVARNEQRSWVNSLTAIHLVLSDTEIAADASVAIDLQVPQTSKLIDLIVTARDDAGTNRAVVLDLTQ